MIALDTNVVVRLFVEDDAAQTAAAAALVRRAKAAGAKLFVSEIVLCEFAWVLRSCYGRSRAEIVSALEVIGSLEQVECLAAREVAEAVRSFRTGRGDFADYLIREQGLAAGAAFVATFDRALVDEPGFAAPDAEAWPEHWEVRERPPARRRRR